MNYKKTGYKKSNNRINNEIMAPRVRLIDDEGSSVMSFDLALQKAKSKSLDLVEITAQEIPIVKILDYGKYLFNKIKKDKENKKKQKTSVLKEIKMGPKIDIGDYERKCNMANKFLTNGDNVKITMRFRGREMAHTNIAKIKMEEFADLLKSVAILERRPILEGRQMTMILRPKK